MEDCFARVYREEGLCSFLRGNLADVIKIFPTKAINFLFKDPIDRLLVKGINPQKNPIRFLLGVLVSGGIAGSITLLFVYPLDFAKTRLSVDVCNVAGKR